MVLLAATLVANDFVRMPPHCNILISQQLGTMQELEFSSKLKSSKHIHNLYIS
jgi:hypothetical protein